MALAGFITTVAKVSRVSRLEPPPLWNFPEAAGPLAFVLTLALLVALAAASGVGAPLIGRVGHLLVAVGPMLFVPYVLYWNLVYAGL